MAPETFKIENKRGQNALVIATLENNKECRDIIQAVAEKHGYSLID